MSDGPHKSLNMRRGWKKVAESADNDACSPSEIAEWVPAALKEDWGEEVPSDLLRRLRQVFVEHQASLFFDNVPEAIEGLRNEAAGAPFAGALLDHAIETADSDHLGYSGFVQAVNDALLNRALNCVRQIEEHYFRETDPKRAKDIRTRVEGAVGRVEIEQLARDLAEADGAPPIDAPKKKSDIDEGVQL